jgi:sortase A
MNKGKLFVIVGVFLILISLTMTVYNKYEDLKAGKDANETLNIIKNEITSQKHVVDTLPTDEVREMKTININGDEFIGTITIPSINLELPVLSKFSNSNLKKAPCRYYGNLFTNDLIICAHAYETFFANLNKLKQNDLIIFTDVDGNIYTYEVLEVEVLKETDVDKMVNNEFDLTLYTCTYDNTGRVTVRCNRVNM